MRPELNPRISPGNFQAYYWLKKELISFCRTQGISSAGGKSEIKQRILQYLETGEIPHVKVQAVQRKKPEGPITLDSPIPTDYRNDQRHRSFFLSAIGPHFKFNTAFMNWMKANSGKTYQNAVDQWKRIALEKKRGIKSEIPGQFEYNQYTRDFFLDNPRRSRREAVLCWKYKRSLPGHNRYEESDLSALVQGETHERNPA